MQCYYDRPDPAAPLDSEEETFKQPTALTRGQQELLHALVTFVKPLNSLVTAVWVLIIVIALYAVFK